jgi:glucose-1-phosphate cytidylyltransferase
LKTVILCGGKGTRLSEETAMKPKPMVEIGPFPILWHIMDIYSRSGYNDFILALGYKGSCIKEFFLNYFAKNSDLTVDLSNGEITYHKKNIKQWKITLVDTGEESMTGGRLLPLKEHLAGESSFMLTYGDGVANVNIKKLADYHKSHGKKATITSVHPIARFGELTIKDNTVTCFEEKPQLTDGWINGGFFVFSTDVLNYIDGANCILEKKPLETLAKEGQLMTFKHHGFWQCMDTLRDKILLQSLWETGDPPWTNI